ncbi:MAG: hypothetical protein HFE43_11310 [Oscillospiraceae bacterium]|nr:hypothetical protein [Oscillospiraceae bacterium]
MSLREHIEGENRMTEEEKLRERIASLQVERQLQWLIEQGKITAAQHRKACLYCAKRCGDTGAIL